MIRVHRLWLGSIAAATCFACQPGCQHADVIPGGQVTTMAAAPDGRNLTGQQVADVKIAMGVSLENQGNLKKAAEYYQDALKRDSSRSDAYRGLARIRDREGRFAESLDLYRKALSASPGSADVYCDMGYSLYLQRNWGEAEKNLRQAVAISADHVRAHNNLALVLAFTDRTDEALAEFRKGGCKEADAQMNVAFALAMERRLPEASQHYQLALAADPNSVSAKRDLAELNAALAKLNGTVPAALPAATPMPARPTDDTNRSVAALPATPAPVNRSLLAAHDASSMNWVSARQPVTNPDVTRLPATPAPVERSLLPSHDASSMNWVSARQPATNPDVPRAGAVSIVNPAYPLVPVCRKSTVDVTPSGAVVASREGEGASRRSAAPRASSVQTATPTAVDQSLLASHEAAATNSAALAQRPTITPQITRAGLSVVKPACPLVPVCDKTTKDQSATLPARQVPVASAREPVALARPCATRIPSMEAAPCCGAPVACSCSTVVEKTGSGNQPVWTASKKTQSPRIITLPVPAASSTVTPEPAPRKAETASDEPACIHPLAEIEKELRRKIAEGHGSSKTHDDLGAVLSRGNCLGEAFVEFRRAGCSEHDAHIRVAASLAAQKRWSEARLHCIYALTADPASEVAKRLLQEANTTIVMTGDPSSPTAIAPNRPVSATPAGN
jgi:hypothetical protein